MNKEQWTSSFDRWFSICVDMKEGKEIAKKRYRTPCGYCDSYRVESACKYLKDSHCPLYPSVCGRPESLWDKFCDNPNITDAFGILEAIYEHGKELGFTTTTQDFAIGQLRDELDIGEMCGSIDATCVHSKGLWNGCEFGVDYDCPRQHSNTKAEPPPDPCPDCLSCPKKKECVKDMQLYQNRALDCQNASCIAHDSRYCCACRLTDGKLRPMHNGISVGVSRNQAINCPKYKGGDNEQSK